MATLTVFRRLLNALGGAFQESETLHLVLLVVGASGGLYALPLMTWIQAHAPPNSRGRVIAATNFATWIFIFLSAGYFALASALLPTEWVPASLGVITLVLLPSWRRSFAALGREERPAD